MILTDVLIVFGFTLTIAILLLMHRATMILSGQLLQEIDSRMAEAIKSVISELPLEGVEPPSPLAQFLLGMLQQNVQAGGTPRDMKGQFSSVIEIDGDSS